MATFNGVNYSKFTSVPKEFVVFGDVGGEVKCMYDKVTYDQALTIGDTLFFGAPIPKHARIIQVVAKATNGGTTGIVEFGDATDTDGLLDVLDMGISAKSSATSTIEPYILGFNRLANEMQVIATCTEATTETSGSIELFVLYSVA